jgi:hypothetical protein
MKQRRQSYALRSFARLSDPRINLEAIKTLINNPSPTVDKKIDLKNSISEDKSPSRSDKQYENQTFLEASKIHLLGSKEPKPIS